MDCMEYLMILQWKLFVEIDECIEEEKRNYLNDFYITEEVI
jgi:hypothetical protein